VSARRAALALSLLSLLLLTTLLPAQPGKDQPLPEDPQKVDTKATRVTPAASIPFRTQFGLPYPSLNTLGTRIDAARRASDPIALGHAASELSLAENVSGKKASLTSQMLLKEAAEAARLRKREAELRGLLRLSNQIAGEQSTIDMLKQQIAEAQALAQAHRQFQEPNWTPRKLTVNNYTTQFIDVNVNGTLRLQIPPGETRSCMIEHRWNPVVLTAYGDEDSAVWGPRNIWGRWKEYTWNLN
jgi:hypothetical protein